MVQILTLHVHYLLGSWNWLFLLSFWNSRTCTNWWVAHYNCLYYFININILCSSWVDSLWYSSGWCFRGLTNGEYNFSVIYLISSDNDNTGCNGCKSMYITHWLDRIQRSIMEVLNYFTMSIVYIVQLYNSVFIQYFFILSIGGDKDLNSVTTLPSMFQFLGVYNNYSLNMYTLSVCRYY